MELTHLVRPLNRWSRRHPLATFALLGTLLFAGRRAVGTGDPEPATLVVSVEAGASATEVERATDDAILLEVAVRAGFVRRDPAVRDRLVRNLRFAEPSLSEADALEQAMELGMHRSDPVARQRLIWLATGTLARLTRREPTEAELAGYLRQNADRFRTPPTVTFEQVFVSRERHGGAFEARVQEVAARPGAASSDASLLPEKMSRALPARIDARFGAGFSKELLALDEHTWSGPIRSAFGVHFVRVLAHSPGYLPSLDRLRERVLHEHERDSESERVRGALSRMRDAYRIRLEEST